MRIHIARDGQALGVLSLEDLNRELAEGRIVATDLAWYEGASGWMPVGQVPGVVAPQRTVWTPPAAQLTEHVEPGAPLGELGYAGFWKRVVARLLDTVICMIIAVPIGGVMGGVLGASGHASAAEPLGNVIGIVVVWLYFALQESSAQQATLGKRALGIIVTDIDGRRISFGRACGRHFAAIVNYFTLFIGWIMAGFTARKQGLHDMIAGTLVLNREPGTQPIPAWAIVILVLFAGGIPILGILAAIAIPAYADYTNRAKVSEAILTAEPAKLAVSEYYLSNAALPESLEAAGFTSTPTKQVSAIALDEGVIVVTLKNGNTIGLEPYAGGDNKLAWRCGKAAPPRGTDIAPGDSAALTTVRDIELPARCR